jgi:alkanesulfonate monooxygenase
MGATFQRLSKGRLLVNVVTGGESAEARAYGDFLDKEGRYARADEFLSIVGALWSGRRVDFQGSHLAVEDASLVHPPDPVPAVYFGGSSPAAIAVAARHADVYLTWGEPPGQVTDKIDEVRTHARAVGRTLRFGIRLHVITRDRAGQAWAEAARLLEGISDQRIATAQAGLATSESEGQRRMRALHRGSTTDLEVAPNLWAGIGLVRGGAGTALVGSHDEVAERILEYHALGIDEFILSGYPDLEEAYWFGEGVLPRLALLDQWRHPALADSPPGPSLTGGIRRSPDG